MLLRRSILILGAAAVAAASREETETKQLAPYVPTPMLAVEKMLELGQLRPGERMFDLGSGDGRIVIMAARKFGADATGVEIDPDLCRQSLDRVRKLKLEKRVHIIHGDLLAQDYSAADLITVYLWPSANDRIGPMLERQLKKGARIVCDDFPFSVWTPEKTVDLDDDGTGRSRTLFLYRR